MTDMADDYATDYARAVRYSLGYTHADFLKAIDEDHSEHLPSLAYADWLAENGMEGAAKLIRDHLTKRGSVANPIWQFSGKYSSVNHTLQPHNPAIELYPTIGSHGPFATDTESDPVYVVRMAAPTGMHNRFLTYWGRYSPEDAHAIVSQMGDIPNAKMATEELESRHPWLRSRSAE